MMSVVCVRKMRVRVPHRRVAVAVRVLDAFGHWRFMLMPVMRVMHVLVLMLHRFVIVFMLVAFAQVQPEAHRHQRPSYCQR